MKRLIVCCDGTWNRLDAKEATNVVIFAEAVAQRDSDGIHQCIYYDEGVGTSDLPLVARIDRIFGGAFGWGLMDKVARAYRFLVFNYVPGDEIFILGFSRGAYTARSLAGLIRNCGIVEQRRAHNISGAISLYKGRDVSSKPDAPDSLEFRFASCPATYTSQEELDWRIAEKKVRAGDQVPLNITYLGVWDTVGALGVPHHLWISKLFNSEYGFHDDQLSRSVKSARHAVAIDETRRTFEPTLWGNLEELNDGVAKDPPYQQKWFPGGHGSVGGGGNVRGLSHRGLLWIMEGARNAGLQFHEAVEDDVQALVDHRASLTNSNPPVKQSLAMRLMSRMPRKGPADIGDVDISAQKRWCASADELPEKKLYRPKTLAALASALTALCAKATGG